LHFRWDFAQPLDHVPTSVTHLVLFRATQSDGSIIRLPSTVTHLAMHVLSGLSVDQVSAGQLEFLAFFDSPLFEWSSVQQSWETVSLKSGQTLTAEQLAEPTPGTVYQWKKPAAPKRRRAEDDAGPSVKRA